MRASRPYVRVDGATVASDWDDLTDGSLQNSISITEDGSLLDGNESVWTNTAPDGTEDNGNSCLDWTSVSGSLDGSSGMPWRTDTWWTATGGAAYCNSFHQHLYCFEQPDLSTACNDGLDNDGDGLTDAADPGCASGADTSEVPDPDPMPACANGADDDGDGLTDYPDDPGCSRAADEFELDCVDSDPVVDVSDMATYAGDTSAATDDVTPGCWQASTAPDVVHLFLVPGALDRLVFDTAGSSFTTVLSVKYASCDSTSLRCNVGWNLPGSEVILTDVPAGTYFAVVDGVGTASGAYTLNIHGVVAAGEPCDADQIAAGVVVCVEGHTCGAASGTCDPAQCNDGLDNDGDGLGDDTDPGCESSSDDSEEPNPFPLPACADGLDNDGDGQTDYPDDPGCTRAFDDNEIECIDSDPVVNLTQTGMAVGTTEQATNDFTPSCGGGAAQADVAHEFTVPGAMDSLTFDATGIGMSPLDVVLTVKRDGCVGAELGCDYNDGDWIQLITLTDQPAGTYFVIVDGKAHAGEYGLQVHGVVSAGERCDAVQIAGGVVECALGYSCGQVTGTCDPVECSDGLDNDGDGRTDNMDPGCQSHLDPSEAPDPDPLPACADGADNDGDGLTDFPDDPGCHQAFDSSENDDVFIPAGPFVMGSDSGEGGSSELPEHVVTLSAYYIDVHEVTNAQYLACVAAGGCSLPSSTGSATHPDYHTNPTYGDYPVIYVSWDQASAFCAWNGKRLPTEAEWEKAARGGCELVAPATCGPEDERTYPWGEAALSCSLANNCGPDTFPVGSLSPAGDSPYGVRDMSGNVAEWVADYLSSDYSWCASGCTDPTGPASGIIRGVRDGAYYNIDSYFRVAHRGGTAPSMQRSGIGFRCAASP